FNDLPRYAQGYAALFNSISITVETHMLKPFPKRVQATKSYLSWIFSWSKEKSELIEKARKMAVQNPSSDLSNTMKFSYELTDKKDSVLFKGYEFGHKPSEVSGKERLFYDRSKPFTKYIPYFQTYHYRDSVQIPAGYIVSKEAEA